MRSPLIALTAFALMEPITALTHRYVMHGVGLALHRSHHRRVRPGESEQRWEANDAFPIMFAAVVMFGLAIGFNVRGWSMLVPVGVGITAYGAAYALVHDIYIHHRLRLFGGHLLPGFERLARAHRVHHERNGAPYGMLLPLPDRRPGRQPIRCANGSRPSHDPLDA
ncbi:MAG: carotene hydroxylase [Actinomycetota bacterium]|jgi:beta-carotene 3-hydroxylase